MSKATIRDVAVKAGVSVSTVSRVLGKKPDVADHTKAVVDAAIESLRFEPRRSSRRGPIAQAEAIAVLMPDYGKFRTEEANLVMGAALAAARHGYLFSVVTEPLDRNSLLELYRSGQVRGVILSNIRLADWRVAALLEHQLPFVAVGRPEDSSGVSYVDLDCEAVVDEMTSYLVSLGHSHIGFVSRPRSEVDVLGTATRLQRGIEIAVSKYQLTGHVVNTDLDPYAAGQALRQILGRDSRTTAVITLTGFSATGTLDALRELEISVPDDVSAVGLITDLQAELIRPTLSGVVYSNAESGDMAVSVLMRLVEQADSRRKGELEQVLITPPVTIRGSSGPAKTGQRILSHGAPRTASS